MPRSTLAHEDNQFEQELTENVVRGIDATFVLAWVASNFEPEDIFDHNDLSRWALNNGFTEEE